MTFTSEETLGTTEFPTCGDVLASFEKLPWLDPQDPAGRRSDEVMANVPTLRFTDLPCAAIAARHARDAFDNDLHDPNLFVLNNAATHVNERRKRLEWDLALACRFVQTVDRVGVTRTWAMNYRGDVLAAEEPSPTGGSARVVTTRRYNADSLLLEETRADGTKTQLAYDGATTTFQADRTLRRGNVLTHTEVATAPTSALETAKQHTLSSSTTVTSQVWNYTYDPLFQQMKTAAGPEGTTTTTYYDWEQSGSQSLDIGVLKGAYLRHTGVASTAIGLGVDFDGDEGIDLGLERSAQPVLQVVTNVGLGAGESADVGVRMRRDVKGHLLQTSRIQQFDDADQDFDVVAFDYYGSVAESETGGPGSTLANGPLRSTTVLRYAGATDPNDLDQTVVAYDAAGGVRSSVRNDDVATTVLTSRNALGQVIEQEAYGESTLTTHDARGHVIATVRSAADTQPVVSVFVWGNQATPLGSCVEIASGACAPFETYALDVIADAKAQLPLDPPLVGARFVVPLLDDLDRVIGRWDTAGARVDLTFNDAGFVTTETHAGTPDTVVKNTFDSGGRLTHETAGTSTTDQLEWFHKWDTLGRHVASESRASLLKGAFGENDGTTERVGYDLGNRVVLSSVVGDSTLGRRALAVTRSEVNGVGVPLFVHRYASGLLSAVSTKASSGVSPTDGWASESFALDAALRPQTRLLEGVVDEEFFSHDGFGPQVAGTATAYTEWIRVPRLRTLNTRLVRNADDYSVYAEATIDDEVDARGNLVQRTARDSNEGVDRVSTSSFDGFGRPALSIDPTGRRQSFAFDVLSQLVEMRELNSAGVEQRRHETVYDDAGRAITERIDSGAPETNFVYDVRGRLVDETTATHHVHLERDAAGRLITHARTATGGLTRTRTFNYLENRAAPQTITVPGGALRSVTRDGLDRPTEASDFNLVTVDDSADSIFRGSRPTLKSKLTFDSLGRVTVDQTLGTFPSTSPVLPSQSNVEIAKLTTTWPTTYAGATSALTKRSENLAFTYNDAGRMATLARTNAAVGTTIGFHYLGDNWTSATTTAGRTVSRTRNAFGEINATALTTLATGGTTHFSESVLRGPTGRIVATRTTSTLATAQSLGTRLRGYSYDALARLAKFRIDGNSTMTSTAFENLRAAVLANENQEVVANPDDMMGTTTSKADNLTKQSTDEAGRVFNATYSTTEHGVPPTTVNGSKQTRDGLDRTSSDGNLLYTHDAADRLVLVTSSSGAVEEQRLAYDGLGRRRMERTLLGPGTLGTGTKDRVLEYWQGNVIEEADTDSTTSSGIAVTTTHAPGLDVPVLTTNGKSSLTTISYALGTNARGDVVSAIKESNAGLIEEQELDPWGERSLRRPGVAACVDGGEGSGSGKFSKPLSACGPVATVLGRFGIGGARQHERTKLVDLRNRVYATHLRMFLTKDPLGNVDAEGLYAYVAADPVNLRDPWGLASTPPAGPTNCTTQTDGGSVCRTGPPAAEPDLDAPDAGKGKQSCDEQCERAKEIADRKAQKAERDAYYREQRSERRANEAKAAVAAEKPADGSTFLDALSDAWDGLIDALSFGDAAVDLSIGMHRHDNFSGAMGPPSIEKKAHDVTEVLVPMAAGGVVGGLGRVANAANHAFGPKSLVRHKLGAVLSAFGGDQVAAFTALEGAAQQQASAGAIAGIFETTVEVAGQTVTVKGAVIDGIVNIGTAFIP
jgi:RHS repeat-associated protein